jgi:hypothetical protein
MVSGPNPRFISNRIFNSLGVDVFSERNISQLVWVWGQSLDHTFGFAKGGGEAASIASSDHDPLEHYTTDLGAIPFTRDAIGARSGLGRRDAREQINTVSSYIDASLVYGSTRERLDRLRAGGEAPGRPGIRRAYGIDHRVAFADLIARNTHVHRTDLSDTAFFAPPPEFATPLGANAT